jgi:hypothetical protein
MKKILILWLLVYSSIAISLVKTYNFDDLFSEVSFVGKAYGKKTIKFSDKAIKEHDYFILFYGSGPSSDCPPCNTQFFSFIKEIYKINNDSISILPIIVPSDFVSNEETKAAILSANDDLVVALPKEIGNGKSDLHDRILSSKKEYELIDKSIGYKIKAYAAPTTLIFNNNNGKLTQLKEAVGVIKVDKILDLIKKHK